MTLRPHCCCRASAPLAISARKKSIRENILEWWGVSASLRKPWEFTETPYKKTSAFVLFRVFRGRTRIDQVLQDFAGVANWQGIMAGILDIACRAIGQAVRHRLGQVKRKASIPL